GESNCRREQNYGCFHPRSPFRISYSCFSKPSCFRRVFPPRAHYISMADPLLLPAIAVALGILLARLLDLSVFESAWPVAAFLTLSFLSWFFGGRGPRPAADPPIGPNRLGKTCILLALLFGGSLTEAFHRPGPPPEIVSGPREILLLEGC